MNTDQAAELTEYPQVPRAQRSHRRAWTVTVGTVVAAGLIVAAAFIVPPVVAAANQAAYNTAQAKAQAEVPAAPVGDATTADEQQTLAQSDTDGAQAIADEQAAEAAAALAAQQAATAAAAARATADSPAKCPAGSVAGAVDGAGNESNCQPENGNGEICQAYNDANQCTAWGKP